MEVMLARAALLASALLSYLCPASYPLRGKSNTLNGEGKHYDCNRTWNEISVSPITTFLHIVAVVEKPFTVSPASALSVISLEWWDDTLLHALNAFNDLQAHEIFNRISSTHSGKAEHSEKLPFKSAL